MEAETQPGACTTFRDQARARLAAAPPDAGFYHAGRRRWRDRVSRLARLADEVGPDDSTLGPILRLAFRALLPLADPGWWRAHPQARLNAEARRRLRKIDKWRRQALRRRKKTARHGGAEAPLSRLQLRAFGAAAIYARHGDGAALDLALRLIEVLEEALAGTGGDCRWPDRSRTRGPANTNRRPCPLGAGRHNAGRVTPPARERRNDV